MSGAALVDANGVVLGNVVDTVNGLVVRTAGNDKLLVQATANGIVQSTISFAHTTRDCSGPRMVPNMNGAGFVFYAMVSGTTVVYTRLIDPTYSVSLTTRATETMAPGQSMTTRGVCSPLPSVYTQSMGDAVIQTDIELGSAVAPLHIQ